MPYNFNSGYSSPSITSSFPFPTSGYNVNSNVNGNANLNDSHGGIQMVPGTPQTQVPSTPRPLRPRPLPLESPGIFDFMDPNLTPIDQELKAGGFGMFGTRLAFGSPGVNSGSGSGAGAGVNSGSGAGAGAGARGVLGDSPIVNMRGESASVNMRGESHSLGSAFRGGESPTPGGRMKEGDLGRGFGYEAEGGGGGVEGQDGRGEAEGEGGGGKEGRAGLLDFDNAELEGYTSAQLYDLNQALLNDSVPTRPLIDQLAPLITLREEYENGNANFVAQIDGLMDRGFKYFRRTRGDGDCFYRSLAFAYIHSLIHSSDREMAVARALSMLSQTPGLLDSVGIEKMVYEDFYEEVYGLVGRVVVDKTRNDGRGMGDEGLLEAFQNAETSNAVVIYLRFVTSAFIRLNPDQFEGFVEHPDTREPMDVESYCANFVQAMGKEADNVEIQALVGVLQLNVDVAYINGGSPNVDFIEFRNDVDLNSEPLVLLYRPGHYDILSRIG